MLMEISDSSIKFPKKDSKLIRRLIALFICQVDDKDMIEYARALRGNVVKGKMVFSSIDSAIVAAGAAMYLDLFNVDKKSVSVIFQRTLHHIISKKTYHDYQNYQNYIKMNRGNNKPDTINNGNKSGKSSKGSKNRKKQ